MSQEPKKVLGKILLEQQSVRPQDLERVAAQTQPGGPPLASRLIEAGVVTELDALKALSTQRGVPGIDLHQICIKLVDLSSIPREIALVHKLLPVLDRPDRIFIAMANPEDKKVIEEIEFVTGKRVFAYIALEATLLRAIREACDARDRGDAHYVGPTYPAEVLRKAGLDPAAYGRQEPPVADAPAVPTAPLSPPGRKLSPQPFRSPVAPTTDAAGRPAPPVAPAPRVGALAAPEDFAAGLQHLNAIGGSGMGGDHTFGGLLFALVFAIGLLIGIGCLSGASFGAIAGALFGTLGWTGLAVPALKGAAKGATIAIFEHEQKSLALRALTGAYTGALNGAVGGMVVALVLGSLQLLGLV